MNNRRRLGALSEHMETRLVLSPLLGLPGRANMSVGHSAATAVEIDETPETLRTAESNTPTVALSRRGATADVETVDRGAQQTIVQSKVADGSPVTVLRADGARVPPIDATNGDLEPETTETNPNENRGKSNATTAVLGRGASNGVGQATGAEVVTAVRRKTTPTNVVIDDRDSANEAETESDTATINESPEIRETRPTIRPANESLRDAEVITATTPARIETVVENEREDDVASGDTPQENTQTAVRVVELSRSAETVVVVEPDLTTHDTKTWPDRNSPIRVRQIAETNLNAEPIATIANDSQIERIGDRSERRVDEVDAEDPRIDQADIVELLETVAVGRNQRGASVAEVDEISDSSNARSNSSVDARPTADEEEVTTVVPVLSNDGTRVVLLTRTDISSTTVVQQESRETVSESAPVEKSDSEATTNPVIEIRTGEKADGSAAGAQEVSDSNINLQVEAEETVATMNTPTRPNVTGVSSTHNRRAHPQRHVRLPVDDADRFTANQHDRTFVGRASTASQYRKAVTDSQPVAPAFWSFEDQPLVNHANDDCADAHTVFGDATRLGIMLAAINHAGRRSGSMVNISALDDDVNSDGGGASPDRRRRKSANSRKLSKAAHRLRRAFNPFEAIDEERAIPCVSDSPDLVFADAASMCVLFHESDSSTAGTSRSSFLGGLLLGATATGVAMKKATQRRRKQSYSRPKPATPRYNGDTVVFTD